MIKELTSWYAPRLEQSLYHNIILCLKEISIFIFLKDNLSIQVERIEQFLLNCYWSQQ